MIMKFVFDVMILFHIFRMTGTAIPRYDQSRFWAFSGLIRMQKRSQNPTKKYICISINVRSNDN